MSNYLQERDLSAFLRFCECCEDPDAGGHDVPKEAMLRLVRIGVIRSLGFGRHETTAFGSYIYNQTDKYDDPLPLRTQDDKEADFRATTTQKEKT